MIENLLKNTKLAKIDGTWVLLYNDQEYMRLLDATSREDAEQQIAEMLMLRQFQETVTGCEDNPQEDTSQTEG